MEQNERKLAELLTDEQICVAVGRPPKKLREDNFFWDLARAQRDLTLRLAVEYLHKGGHSGGALSLEAGSESAGIRLLKRG